MWIIDSRERDREKERKINIPQVQGPTNQKVSSESGRDEKLIDWKRISIDRQSKQKQHLLLKLKVQVAEEATWTLYFNGGELWEVKCNLLFVFFIAIDWVDGHQLVQLSLKVPTSEDEPIYIRRSWVILIVR